jgi:phenylacetate-CoA ligase
MIDRIIGRTDDMIKVKGVNIYPGQIEDALRTVNGLSSEYQVIIEHADGKDNMTLKVETCANADKGKVCEQIQYIFKQKIGIKIQCECMNLGELPRSEKKAKRVFDYRDK